MVDDLTENKKTFPEAHESKCAGMHPLAGVTTPLPTKKANLLHSNGNT